MFVRSYVKYELSWSLFSLDFADALDECGPYVLQN